jgi:primase-polymerase (primpol)-like protein
VEPEYHNHQAQHVEGEGTREIQPENTPEEMRRRPQWVVWKLEQRDGKPTKIPYIAGGVGKADTTDLMTWRTFDEAVQALGTGRYAGIGFVFCSGDPFTGIDLDGCRDPETGGLEGWAAELVASFGGYAEASPSGTGVHIIVRGKSPNKKRGRVEAYSVERFFTMTGQAL